VYTKGYGWQDRAKRIPASEKTVYRLGSISKSVTATATMQLWESKKIDLDADIRKYVPEYPEKRWVVTARQILSHTSGIRHYDATDKSVYTHFEWSKDAMQLFNTSPLLFEPGSKYSYSTHAFTVLASALEKIEGKPFPILMRQNLFRKIQGTLRCEMPNSTDKNQSALYTNLNGQQVDAGQREDNSWKFAGGGMEADVVALGRFGSGMIKNSFVKQTTRDMMWSSFKLSNGKTSNYGLGFAIGDNGVVNHGGAQQGCRTFMYIDAVREVVVVIMTNTGNSLNSAPTALKLANIWVPKSSPL
jgi:CubicO group peptidase (beta-lactamase class C family)